MVARGLGNSEVDVLLRQNKGPPSSTKKPTPDAITFTQAKSPATVKATHPPVSVLGLQVEFLLLWQPLTYFSPHILLSLMYLATVGWRPDSLQALSWIGKYL
jgi:hypothetical protein